jgi:hypothetical protein
MILALMLKRPELIIEVGDHLRKLVSMDGSTEIGAGTP